MRRLLALAGLLLLTAAAFAQAPVISNVAVSNVTPTSFTVTWTTDIASDTFVGWGDNYYNTDAGASDTSTGVTSHSQTISGLHPGTSYLYVIRSRAFTAGVPDNAKVAFKEATTGATTSSAPTDGTLDYWFAVRGAHHVTQGYELYLGTKGGALSGSASYKDNTYKVIVTDLPPYTAVHWTDQEYNGVGQGARSTTYATNDSLTLYSLGTSSQIALTTNVGGTTPAGTYTVHVLAQTTKTDNTAGPSKDVAWTVTVDAPTSLTLANPSSYPAIPELATWQSQMTTYGAKWCLQTGAPYEQDVWYYDGLNVFYRISDYTKDAATWAPCIASVRADYRNYVIANNGAIAGYRVFPHGLYTDYLRTGDTVSKDAVHLLGGTTGLKSGSVPPTDARNVREMAYELNAARLDTKLGNDRSDTVRQLVNVLLGHIDQIAVSHNAEWYQPFMCGLLAEALIGYYEDGNQSDTRIPVAIKELADYLYANAWNHTDYEAGAFIYNSYQQSIGMPTAGSEQRGLNLLIAPMYGWLYKLTGDATYQTQGDEIWQQGVTAPVGATVNWSGKNFSQNYRWSFDYVNWRSQPSVAGGVAFSGVTLSGVTVQ